MSRRPECDNSEFTAVFGMGGDDRLRAGYYTGSWMAATATTSSTAAAATYFRPVEGGAGDDIVYRYQRLAESRGGEGNDTIYSTCRDLRRGRERH